MQTLSLRDYQESAIDALLTASESGMQRPAVVLPTGTGKGHPLTTLVHTTRGLIRWGDLTVGDHVFGSDGHPTQVTAIFDRGVLPTYRVTLSDGASVDVDGDHLWTVRDSTYRRTSREVRTVSTRDLMREGLRCGSGWRFRLPQVGAIQRPTARLPIGPYTLGALIANGYLAGSGTQLTTPDQDVVSRVRDEGYDVVPIADTTPGVCPRYSLPGLQPAVQGLGLAVRSAAKHIPPAYLVASVPQRLALLQGLMDGDGSSRSGGRRSVLYHTTSRPLAGGVVELVNSLGGTATITAGAARPDELTVYILLPNGVNPFGTRRKADREAPRRTLQPRRAIVGIEEVEPQAIRCITVAADDSLYRIGRQYIVTHNTVIFTHLIQRLTIAGRRVLILVDREELVDQTGRQLLSACPGLAFGVVKAERNDWAHPVVIGSVQTLRRVNRLEQIPNDQFDVTIVDECDLAAAEGYLRILTYFGCFTPESGHRAYGFTATMSREDNRGLGGVWDDVVFRRDILDMIKLGHLSDVRGLQVTLDDLDLSAVARAAGDYQDGSLGDAMVNAGAGPVIATSYLEHARRDDGTLKRGIGFAPTIAAATAFHQAFVEAGIPSELVIGSTSTEDRQLIYKRTRSGDNIMIWSVGVLTRGFDLPEIEMCVIARPTSSRALYVQMVGRVLRPAPWIGKTVATVLDVVGVSSKIPLCGMVDLSETVIPEPKQGETLIEAAIRKEIEEGRKPSKQLTGRLAAEQVDLFHRSDSMWLQSYKGVWFIPTRKYTYFLWPCANGNYRVGRAETYGARGTWLPGDFPVETARSWAEQYASQEDSSVAGRKSAWRKKKDPPSEAQMGLLERYNLPVPETKNEASNLISIHIASRWLDKNITSR